MIPIALAFGLIGGFTRLKWWSVAVVAIGWGIFLASSGDPSIHPVARLVAGAAVAAANAAVGVVVAVGVGRVLQRVLHRLGQA